ncbi:hypothetical protein SAMN05216188_110141 [Lentzea xinjiangensis]|uniref:Uncharacterized protein n=1 Tax=Lentzea xinjiangensis TaxID=402600 RepID=A0A1H9NDA6_9PSEU|nr:hypothetical protein [Lentzea xinjiangensis]SER33747.1 hypothetical protein SAMN05216188_110141 [Lentzea xinjiangensis]
MRAATVVLPSGELVRADASNPDLLWAVRGAGSYVGVVTDFDIEGMHLPGIHAGQVVIEIDDGGVALRRWSESMANAPRELTMSGILTTAEGGRPVLVMTAVLATSDLRVAEAALAPWTGQSGVHRGLLGRGRYAELVSHSHLHPNVGQ